MLLHKMSNSDDYSEMDGDDEVKLSPGRHVQIYRTRRCANACNYVCGIIMRVSVPSVRENQITTGVQSIQT